MNFVNRIIIVMLLLFALVGSCGAFLIVLFARPNIAATLQPTLNAISDTTQILPQLFCLGVALLAAVFAVLLLYLELMPTGKVRMRLKSIQGADVLMSSDAITSQLQYALEPLPGVIRAVPHVGRGKGETVDVLVDMTTTADVDIKAKTDEVMDITRTVLEGGLGLRVGKVQIKLEQTKPPKKPTPNLPKLDLPRLVAAKQEEAAEKAANS